MARAPLISWQTVVLLHAISIKHHIFCDAQLLSAYEQAYGSWGIKMTKNLFGRRRWNLETLDNENSDRVGRRRVRRTKAKEDGDLQLLFPEMLMRPKIVDKAVDDKEISGKQEIQIQHTKNDQIQTTTTKSVRSVSCILNLEKRGKFTLSLAEEDETNNQNNELVDNEHHEPLYNSPSMGQTTKTTPIINHHPLKGEWFLTPNPYCITDRHYDTLLLVSEPRMRRIQRSAIVEKATVELRCKIWGRYGAGAVRQKLGLGHGRVCGRMTHGTIVIVKEQVADGGVGEKKKLPTREVVGTFQGKTIIDLDSASRNDQSQHAEDESLVGDDDEDADWGLEDNFDEYGVIRTID